MWAVLVFDGTGVEFPPELHSIRASAKDAAERWALILSSNGEIPVRRRGEFQWMAGFRQIIMARVAQGSRLPPQPWIGLTWEEGTYPRPSVELLDGVRGAAAWVGSMSGPTDLAISRWDVAACRCGRATRRAAASRARVISEPRQTRVSVGQPTTIEGRELPRARRPIPSGAERHPRLQRGLSDTGLQVLPPAPAD